MRAWLWIGILGAATVFAQQEQPKTEPAPVLSEREALKKAVSRSRELQAMATEVRVQEERAGCISCNLRNPELRLSDISTKYFYANPGVNKQLQVGLRWRFPRLGEMGLNQQREVVDLWELKSDANAFRIKFVTEVRKTYAELAFLEQYRGLAAEKAALEERHRAAIEGLVNIGQRPLVDKIKAHRRLIKARGEANKISRRYLEMKNQLRALTGEKKDFTAVFERIPEPAPDFQKLHARAVNNHPDLTLAEEQAKLSDLRYRAARTAQIPWFSYVEADYHHESANLDWGELRLGIELPVFRWGSAELDATAIAKEGRGQRQAATVESIDRKIADALAAYGEALDEWRSLQTDTEAVLPGTDALADQAQKQASLPADEVIELELSAVDLRQMALEARLTVEEAAIDLCEAAGVESWEELGK